MRPGRHCMQGGGHLERRKYGIIKFGRFWRIGICIADSDIFTPPTPPWHSPVLGPHRQLSVLHDATQSSVYTKKHCWSNWSFTCCRTVKNPYCPVTVLLGIAIQCLALFTCFQIVHDIWLFDSQKIFKLVATRCLIFFYWKIQQRATDGR